MIFDRLENVSLYAGLGKRFEAATRWLLSNKLDELEPGTIEIQGRDLYVMVQEYQAKTDSAWEAHRYYADIQVLVSGNESILYADVTKKDLGEYNDAKDRYTPNVQADLDLDMCPGNIAIFFPQDGHRPGLVPTRSGKAGPVKKVVVKVKL